MHTIVLGAGISGLTAAYSLSRIPGEAYSIYEKESSPGGLCRTLKREGFTFDAVSHVLHFRSPEAEQLVHDLLKDNLSETQRNASIYYRERYVPYPFQAHLGFLPFAAELSCLAGYWRACWKRHRNGLEQPGNFGEWIQHHYGAGIARHFMTPYNTKLWGTAPEDMSVDWVPAFVPKIPAGAVLSSLFAKRASGIGYNSRLYYPKRGGIQALADGLLARVSPVHLNHRVQLVDLDQKTVTFTNGKTVSYDRLISTMPLRNLALRATGLPQRLRSAAHELKSTSLLNITFCIRRPLPHDFHWIYFPEPQFPFFRLVFPSNINRSLAPSDCSIISAEISHPEPGNEEAITEQTRNLLQRLKLIQEPSDIVFTVANYYEHAYPIHDLRREPIVGQLLEFLRSQDVWSIGRFGAWRYSSIDDSIAEALNCVRDVIQRDELRSQSCAAAL